MGGTTAVVVAEVGTVVVSEMLCWASSFSSALADGLGEKEEGMSDGSSPSFSSACVFVEFRRGSEVVERPTQDADSSGLEVISSFSSLVVVGGCWGAVCVGRCGAAVVFSALIRVDEDGPLEPLLMRVVMGAVVVTLPFGDAV